MPIEITVPRLGWNMEEGTFVGWLKGDGDPVRDGEPLFSLEGDKATQEVEAIGSGTLRIASDAPSAGDRVRVGVVIGHLAAAGEAIATPSAAKAVALGDHAPTSTPSAAVANRRPRTPRSTPLARRIARDLGVDWTRLAGSGSGNRVRKADVLLAARSAPGNGAAKEDVASVPVSPIRRTIAARMRQSLATAAPVTLTTTLDATNLANLRRQFKDGGPAGRAVPAVTDFFVKLAALALREHPMLNSRWAEDRIEVPPDLHIGIATDTESGLLVPVIRDAAGLSLGQIAERSRDLIRRAREGTLPAHALRGGTFTITNLGAFGIEAFTPILNPPECAILGLGRIAREPVMEGDRVVGRDRMALSLTFDHRIVDGAPAARFLQHLVKLVENPGPWLIG